MVILVRFLLVILLGLRLAAPILAQFEIARDFPKAKKIDEAVEEQIQKQNLVGVAIGVLLNNEIVYLKGYGLADRDKKQPATVETVFNWASNSKPFLAVAAMQLAEQGKLELDADVRKYVPEFPGNSATITVRQLFCHQSGIPHYQNGKIVPTFRSYPNEHAWLDPVMALDKFKESPLLFQPGSEVSYSSFAYVLLSAVVQRAGGKPIMDQLDSGLVKPMGLKSFQLDMETKDQPNWSTGYVKNKENQIVKAREEAHYWKHGGGGYKSNIADFALWARTLLRHERLSAASYQAMWTPQRLVNGKKTGWGLGFMVDDVDGLKISHNGNQAEAASRLVLYPWTKRGVVVLCNCQYADVSAISTAVFKAVVLP